MLSISSLGTAGSGIEEYYEHLAQDDYYQNGGEPPGQWQGRLASELYLFGSVKPGQLGQMFKGFHPLTGQALSTNAGDQHKVGWDLTFSAPKSVSVAWAFSDPDMRDSIEDAHNTAVTAALSYLEKRAFTSRDRGMQRQPMKSILAATFQHGTSRELDPQLHTHATVANIGIRADGTYCALDFDSRYKMGGGAIYRAELASELTRLGYAIERDAKSFKILGIEKSLCDVFSKRRNQILERLQQTGFSSSKAASFAALDTRQVKQLVDRQSLFEAWRLEANSFTSEIDAINTRELLNTNKSLFAQESNSELQFNMDAILKSLTEQASTFTVVQLEAAIAIQTQCLLDAEHIESLIKFNVGSKLRGFGPYSLIRLEEKASGTTGLRRQAERFTTREMLELESKIISQAETRVLDGSHIVSCEGALLKYPTLSHEQKNALHHITDEPGAIKSVRGLAGTGKSFLLKAAHESWFAHNYKVTGAALAGKAAQSLEEGSGIKSQTLHSLLNEISSKKKILSSRDIIVIDEAAMVGSRQMNDILSHIHAAGAKAVLVGDHLQLQPIDAGGIFRALSEKLGYAGLSEIRRQESEKDRAMIHDLIAGKSDEYIKSLVVHGMLEVAPSENVYNVIVNQWERELNPDAIQESLILGGTKSDVYKVNILARMALARKHLLHSEVTVSTEHGDRTMAIGERILFTRNSRALGVKNGQTGALNKWSVDEPGNVIFTIQTDGGKTIVLNVNEYNHLDYGYALSVHKAQGQTVNKVYLLISEVMTDREWAYVATSRHREQLRVYLPEELSSEFSTLLGHSHQKDVSQDFEVIPPLPQVSVDEIDLEIAD